jgi:mannose-1-phosphate guanylyltransferase/phosphomannomutase
MVPLANRPMLEHILLLLKRHGITEVVITVQYMATHIQTQIGDGSDLGMTVTYSVEDQPWAPPAASARPPTRSRKPFWSSAATHSPTLICRR